MSETIYAKIRLKFTLGKHVTNKSIACVKQAIVTLTDDAQYNLVSQNGKVFVIDITKNNKPITSSQLATLIQRFHKWQPSVIKGEDATVIA